MGLVLYLPGGNLGGEITAISLTPATWAGTTVMMTVEGSGAAAPGTQTPARRMGTYLMPVPCENSDRRPMKIFS